MNQQFKTLVIAWSLLTATLPAHANILDWFPSTQKQALEANREGLGKPADNIGDEQIALAATKSRAPAQPSALAPTLAPSIAPMLAPTLAPTEASSTSGTSESASELTR